MRNKLLFGKILVAIISAIIIFLFWTVHQKNIEPVSQERSPEMSIAEQSPSVPIPEAESYNENRPAPKNESVVNQNPSDGLVSPIDRASDRVTKKPFGIFIAPKNSPVQPERFSGYHTGTDFETFPEEANIDVPIHAVCDGKFLAKRTASGYGGVLVQSCTLNGQPITVIYGHLRLVSVKVNVGDQLAAGQPIGVLGTGYSKETDGERKHLHLGIHKGSAINIQGYGSSRAALDSWLNACEYGGCK